MRPRALPLLLRKWNDVGLGFEHPWAKCNLGAESEEDRYPSVGYGDLTCVNQSTYLIDYNTVEDIAGTDNNILKKVNVMCALMQFYSYSRSDE